MPNQDSKNPRSYSGSIKFDPVWLVFLKTVSGHWVLSRDAEGRYPSRRHARAAIKEAKKWSRFRKYKAVKFLAKVEK